MPGLAVIEDSIHEHSLPELQANLHHVLSKRNVFEDCQDFSYNGIAPSNVVLVAPFVLIISPKYFSLVELFMTSS